MKGKIGYILLIFCGLMLFSSISRGQSNEQPAQTVQPPAESNLIESYLKQYYSQVFGVDITGMLNTDLYAAIEKWLGTPYRYAGKTLQGIDCSGFVNMIYQNVYCYLLTGNSSDLFRQVTPLPKESLREGDLVFFKINRRAISHVGLYLGNNKFAHASRSNGVIISDLNSPYYKKYFVKGGRVNFQNN